MENQAPHVPQSFERVWPQLEQDLQAAEQARQDARRSIFMKIIIIALLVLGLLLAFALLHESLAVAIFLGVLLAEIFLIYLAYQDYKKYVQAFKSIAIQPILNALYPNFTYEAKKGISPEIYKASQLFQRHYDRYNTEDYIEGQIDKTKLFFAEVHSEYKVRNNKNTSWHTIFKGLFMVLDANKNFQHRTFVVPDVAESLGAIGRWFQDKTSWINRQGELIYMEDAEFEKLFKVTGDDQIEARYLLTPAKMQRLTELRNQYKRPIYLAFVGGQIYLALSRQENFLEPRFWRSVLDFDFMKSIYDDLYFLLQVVDMLDLNTRIWTKE